MLIVQHQFGEAGIDIRNPNYNLVLDGLDRLAKAEEVMLSATVARVNYEERKRIVDSFKK
jgi:hypothetical protein